MTLEQPKNNWPWVLALVVLVIAAVFAWFHFRKAASAIRAPLPSHTFQAAAPIPAVAEFPKVAIKPPKQLLVLDKKAVARKLDLPQLARPTVPAGQTRQISPTGPTEAATEDAALQLYRSTALTEPAATDTTASTAATDTGLTDSVEVLATAEIPASDNGSEAVTLLDTKTGESSTVVKEKVSPWFQFQNGIVAGLRYGLNTDLEQTGTAYLGWEFLRIKDLHFIGYGEVNTNPQGKIQLDIQYRRK
jgi:hypothetical protein